MDLNKMTEYTLIFNKCPNYLKSNLPNVMDFSAPTKRKTCPKL